MRPRPRALAVALVLAAVVALALAACGGDGDDAAGTGEAGGAGRGVGAALAGAATTGRPGGTGGTGNSGSTTTAGDATTGTTGAGAGASDEGPSGLPAPSFPESSPPTTIEGMDPVSVPGAHGDDPIVGQLVVDLEPGSYVDLPTHLRAGQHIQVLTSADDGIRSRTTVFAPDGSSIATWDSSGRPGEIEGYYWDDDDPLPADGTYVFRVVHLGGAHNPFVLAFYGEA
jgi:hypothetical protein